MNFFQDEGGQFFDHHWTPTPPVNELDGISTVDVTGEVFLGLPIGLGFRVPLFIISPFTRGDIVLSEMLDHTSVIKLLEARFNVSCPNISPWRRAITGNMLSAFDFDHPDYSWPVFPNTSQYVNESNWECSNLPPPVIPAVQSMPTPEPGKCFPLLIIFSNSTRSKKISRFALRNDNVGCCFYKQ